MPSSKNVKQERCGSQTTRRSQQDRSTRPHAEFKIGKSASERWAAIDDEFAARLSAVANDIILANPPIRVTAAELERRTNRRGWVYKNRLRLPQSIAFLKQIVESTESFQTRRIKWAIEQQLQLGGGVRAWCVMRKAGISSKGLNKIKAILADLKEIRYDFK